MQLPRMTTRRWMIAVLTVWTGLAAGRSVGRLRLADRHGRAGRFYTDEALTIGHGLIGKTLPPGVAGRKITEARLRAAYHARERARYLHAACRPWESVSPEPTPVA